jgi:CRISPR-associated helicase Cas3
MVEYVERLRRGNGGVIILDLPTGSGKTRALITHALICNTSAICVYPTNALKQDQRRQIDADVKRSGRTHRVEEIDGYKLTEYAEREDFNRKGTALFHLLNTGFFGGRHIVLTNPDVFMLMLHGRYAMYQQSLNEIARAYPVIAFDEMHTYDLKQLCSLMHTARLLMEVQPFTFIFSTATVSDAMKHLLDAFPEVIYEDMLGQLETGQQMTRPENKDEWERQVLSLLDLAVVGVSDWRGGEWAKANRSMIGQFADDGGCVVIFDSLSESLALYKALREEFGPQRVGLVVGPVHPDERREEIAKDIVVGNNAIRVGIDFVKRNAIIYSRSGCDAIQGLGRVGRGGMEQARAVLLAPPTTALQLNAAFERTREKYLSGWSREIVNAGLLRWHPIYEQFEPYRQRYGLVEAVHVQEVTGIRRPEILPLLFQTEMAEVERVYQAFNRDIIEDLILFRGSKPFSVVVYDADLETQDLFPFYFVDVYRLFRWSEVYPLRWQELDRKLENLKADRFRRELRERQKRRGDILATAKIRWRSTPRRNVAMTNIHVPQPALVQGELRFGKGWEISIGGIPRSAVRVREIACEQMRERAITYLIFNPTDYDLPPLFKYYPLLDTPSFCVAFAHNAFLLHSLILENEVSR